MKQGNIKAFELCERSQKVPCQYWLKYMSTGHVYCECEKAFAPAFKESSISPREIEVCGAVTFFVCVEEELWARSSLWLF